ncbi:MAG: hypothetical protein FJZ00_09045 [Candidatus Sericytochromatia bacterium]|uniref:Uncharacterized protein n=1 Tax=Candidatus Tanganyikabacteria bacterium TaxID=2961651 RepID=A0A938BLH0_9BACT|nr:hypothetical protein [Candidatus Tanganyikabacteria bacterium]
MNPVPAGVRIAIAMPRNAWRAAYPTMLAIGILFALAAVLEARSPDLEDWLGIGVLILIGWFALAQVAQVTVMSEIISVDQRLLTIGREAPLVGRWLGGARRSFDRTAVKNLRYEPFLVLMKPKPFWQPLLEQFKLHISGDAEPQPAICFDYQNQTVQFGIELDATESDRVIREITMRFPAMRPPR